MRTEVIEKPSVVEGAVVDVLQNEVAVAQQWRYWRRHRRRRWTVEDSDCIADWLRHAQQVRVLMMSTTSSSALSNLSRECNRSLVLASDLKTTTIKH